MIARCGTFEYEVEVRVEKQADSLGRKWIGKGKTNRDRSQHPGWIGYQPGFELAGDLLTLNSTESLLVRRTDRHFQKWIPPQNSLSLRVGVALGRVLQAGDLLQIERAGTGDFGISLVRNNKLVLAAGAIVGMPMGTGVELHDDDRLRGSLLKFIRGAPPKDLKVTVRIDDQARDLLDNDETQIGDYYIYVGRTHRVGIPGEQSILAIGRLSETLTKQLVRNSVKGFL